MSVLDAMQRTKNKMPQHLINFAETPGGYVAVLVTDFMYRIHKEMQSACEVVFVDTTSHVDKTNCSLTILVCSSAAGGLPLGVILSSTQTKEDYLRGFTLLQAMLGDVAFNGKLHPECFITDDSDAERGALHEVWPQSKLFLCVFHVLQAAWRWLWNSRNKVANEHRKPLISVLKKLVYAESICSFEEIWLEFLNSELSQNNVKCTEYFRSAVERREEWSLPWRCGFLLRGHNTNNMCESMMMVIKDIVLNRNKAHNGAQLLLVMADVYNNYLRLRLSDVLLKKDSSCKPSTSTIPMCAVTHAGGTVYTVKSASQEGICYNVDLSIGMCSCLCGNTGSVCKHQLAASQYSAVRLPQLYACTVAEKEVLYKVIYGDKPMPTSNFFDGLFADTPVNVVSHVNKEPAARDDEQGDVAVVIETSAQTTNENQSIDTSIDEFTSMINRELKRTKSTCMLSSFAVFEQRLKSCRNPAQVNTFLRTAGCTIFKASGAAKRKIPCQPTTIARRQFGQPRGKAALLKGKITKRKRNLALNILKNLPNAKIH
ncbi:uncharacterized protein LOC143022436 [Oratosquilla oratoria]|uniref:uncharacterized protein LOC143022436 n=1 Tax=Oratosquilla oratoria TaxID=337810 RepID=UPI003F767F18